MEYQKRQKNGKCWTENAGLNVGWKMQDLKMWDWKVEDQRPERVFCGGNMHDCVGVKCSCKTVTVHSI